MKRYKVWLLNLKTNCTQCVVEDAKSEYRAAQQALDYLKQENPFAVYQVWEIVAVK